MIYFVLWTVFKYLFFLSCYPVLTMVTFSRLSVSVMTSRQWTMFYFRQYTFSFFFCLFVFIHLSCSWVTKYLECESLCSSCTRNRNNSYDNNNNKKKNMTKWYRRHSPGGLVYCCIVTLEGGEKKEKKKLFPSLTIFTEEQHFVQTVQFCVCVPIIIIIRCISILQVLQACVQDEKKKKNTCV